MYGYRNFEKNIEIIYIYKAGSVLYYSVTVFTLFLIIKYFFKLGVFVYSTPCWLGGVWSSTGSMFNKFMAPWFLYSWLVCESLWLLAEPEYIQHEFIDSKTTTSNFHDFWNNLCSSRVSLNVSSLPGRSLWLQLLKGAQA